VGHEERENKILSVIQLHGDSSITEIARLTGLRQKSVRDSLSDLVGKQAIHRVVMIDMGRLGFTHYLIYLKQISGGHEVYSRFLQRLQLERQVTAVLALSGPYDLVVNLMARSPSHFMMIWGALRSDPDTPEFEQLITVRPSYHLFGRRFPEYEKRMTSDCLSYTPSEERVVEVPESDLLLLSHYSRLSSVREVARAVGMRESTVSYRLSRLKEQGIILRVVYMMYGRDHEWTTRHLIHIRRHTDQLDKRLYQFCSDTPSIMFLSTSIGGWEYEIQLSSRDRGEAERVKRALWQLFSEEIKSIQSVLQIETKKAISFPYYSPNTHSKGAYI